MTAYNVVSRASMIAGQPEDVSAVLANFDAIAAILNGNLDNSNLNAAAAIAASKLAGFPADGAKVLKGDGTWATLSSGPAFKVAGTYDLVNSIAETSMISGAAASGVTGWQIPANQLGATGAIRVTMIGDLWNNSGGATNWTIRIKFGGTTIYADASSVLFSSGAATRTPFELNFILANMGVTNVQFMKGRMDRLLTSLGTQGVLVTTGDNVWDDSHQHTIPFSTNGGVAIDTTVANYLDVTMQHGTANASTSARRMFAMAEYL